MNVDVEAARSILACAAEIEITVDGEPLALESPIGIQDWSGSPTFVCAPESPLALAGLHGSQVSLNVSSALSEDDTLLLAGHLRHLAVDNCACCESDRALIAVDLSHVLLLRSCASTPIDVADFCDPMLQLNTGYLRRTEQHLNESHGDHLRVAVARLTGRSVRTIGAAQVCALTPTGVDVQWITDDGAHAAALVFGRAARNADELGELLRRALHAEIC